jgi:hypothetical protein
MSNFYLGGLDRRQKFPEELPSGVLLVLYITHATRKQIAHSSDLSKRRINIYASNRQDTKSAKLASESLGVL